MKFSVHLFSWRFVIFKPPRQGSALGGLVATAVPRTQSNQSFRELLRQSTPVPEKHLQHLQTLQETDDENHVQSLGK